MSINQQASENYFRYITVLRLDSECCDGILYGERFGVETHTSRASLFR